MKIYVDDDGIGSDDEDDNGSGEERLLWPPLWQNLALLTQRHQVIWVIW